MMSAIGSVEDIDSISEDMVECGCIHVINSADDLEQNSSIGSLLTMKPYKPNFKNDLLKSKVYDIMDILGTDKAIVEKNIGDILDINKVAETINPLYDSVIKIKSSLDDELEDLNKLEELKKNTENIRELHFALWELENLKFFNFKVSKVKRDYYLKLKENIENIPSIIYRIHSSKDDVYVVSFTPKFSENEASEIFKSLGFEDIEIPERVIGVPEDALKNFNKLISEKQDKIRSIEGNIASLKVKHQKFLAQCSTFFKKQKGIENINSKAIQTDRVFYLSGWVPEIHKSKLAKRMEHHNDRLVLFFRNDDEIKGLNPPTMLKNNRLVKPFEYLVNMYGIPSYGEKDPTVFVAISYMIMFGMMFGDVGQGFMLLSFGLYLLLVKKSTSFGGILTWVGISSTFFGFLYGSVFGSEKIIEPLILRPLENIDTVLLAGILLGIVLSSIGYIYNLINSIKTGDIEEGIFGREGAAGFLFYISILISAFMIYRYGSMPIPVWVASAVIIIFLLLIVLKEPLSRIVEKKRPLHYGSIGDYYVESIFGVIETVLGVLSKTISFIRLGAFALNHAGLFLAFKTIADMMKNSAASFIVLLLGNVIIIGLEGLVVFIQGLRLEYYEIFSRFYKGDGEKYSPVSINYHDDSKDTG